MPTIVDVAREAGVAVGTVSRVLNRSPLVRPATRERVLAVIQRLGYQPSPVARAFGRRRATTIEVLIPVFAQWFVLEVLRGIEDELAGTDYTLLIRTIDDAHDRDRVFAECCARGRAEGALIVGAHPTDTLLERQLAENVRVVLLNVADPRLWSVGVDHAAAAGLAVRHCLALGHRRIALIDRHADPFNTATPGLCEPGYLEALGTVGIELSRGYVQVTSGHLDAGAAALDALLEQPEPPTAIIAGSDTLGVGVLQAARARGQRVPQDVSVVSYNDNELSEFLGVTCVRVPWRDMGRLAAHVLLAALADPNAQPRATVLPTELIVRRSCGVPAS